MLERIDALEVEAGEEVELQRRVARLSARMGSVQAAVEVHATVGTSALLATPQCRSSRYLSLFFIGLSNQLASCFACFYSGGAARKPRRQH